MDVTDATFQEMVIERSHDVPVVVDFWAGWCGPCRQLAPVIEKAVAAHTGEVELAKVDIDQNPLLARTYGVQSIPMVLAFKDGKAVNQFVGLQPPDAVEAFLTKLLPSDADRLAAGGDEASLRAAIDADPGHVQARVQLAKLLLDSGSQDDAEAILTPVSHDPAAAGLLARLRLRGEASPDVAAGLAALERGDLDAALTSFLDAIQNAEPDLRERLRQTMVGVFADLGDQHPTTVRFRKRLSRVLY